MQNFLRLHRNGSNGERPSIGWLSENNRSIYNAMRSNQTLFGVGRSNGKARFFARFFIPS